MALVPALPPMSLVRTFPGGGHPRALRLVLICIEIRIGTVVFPIFVVKGCVERWGSREVRDQDLGSE